MFAATTSVKNDMYLICPPKQLLTLKKGCVNFMELVHAECVHLHAEFSLSDI